MVGSSASLLLSLKRANTEGKSEASKKTDHPDRRREPRAWKWHDAYAQVLREVKKLGCIVQQTQLKFLFSGLVSVSVCLCVFLVLSDIEKINI
jgi:hypothetical protein